MERQRSFSFKPTRILVFSFTISSSIFFIFVFTNWVTKTSPSLPLETHIQFNTSSLTLGLKTVVSDVSLRESSLESNVKESILIDTQLIKQENISGFLESSVVSDIEGENSETQLAENEESEGESFVEKIGEEKNVTETLFTEVDDDEKSDEEEEEEEEEEGKKKTVNENALTSSVEEIVKRNGLVSSVEKVEQVEEEKRMGKCDVTKGKWVYDESYPLYTNVSCPFIDEGFDCIGNGRLDNGYMKLRWQPQDCDIPRFNATKMLELLRGKRLVFVGDSINRNQWESMLCLLMGGIKDPEKVYETHGRRITKEKGVYSFKFVDYKCTVEYYVTHFLVHEGKAKVGRKRVQTLRIDNIDRGSSRWKGADILIFNTAHWWTHFKTKAGVNYYQEEGHVHPRLDVSIAFRKALTTWASWVDNHINPKKTRVFFRSSAPSHFRGGQWNSGGHCKEATLPLPEISDSLVPEKDIIVEEVIKQMRTPVTVLNITGLSGYRIDGHPSTFGKRPGKQYSSRIQDCSHWCLPGVPDSWNELLYAHLESRSGLTGFRLIDQ